MNTVDDVIDLLSRKTISETLGVADTSVSNARKKGVFPPSWFKVIKSLLRAKGQKCPKKLFSFLEPVDPEMSAE